MPKPEQPRVDGLTDMERHLLRVCIDRYISDLRVACLEDQGLADGKFGTLGYSLQRELADLRERVRSVD